MILATLAEIKRHKIIQLWIWGLYELLFVADKEKLICKSNYHLSHYVRDYRNVVHHPAKEIRIQQNISHENTLIMWSVLKQVVNELLR